jgi:hypothetical protein
VLSLFLTLIQANLEIVTGSAQEASSTFNQLRQTGTSAQELISTLTLLGNVAGGSTEKFNRIVANFAQVQSATKATAMDLRQFAMMGIPIYDALQKIGVTDTTTFQDVHKAFQLIAGEGGQFYNTMSKGAKTLQGKVTNLEGTWKSLQATIADKTGFGNAIKYLMPNLPQGSCLS